MDLGENLLFISKMYHAPVLLIEDIWGEHNLASLMRRPFLYIEKRSKGSRYGKVVYDMYTVPYNLNSQGFEEVKKYISTFCRLNPDGIIKIAEDYEKTYSIGVTHGESPYMNLKDCKTVAKNLHNILTNKKNLNFSIEDLFIL
ncbi:MAG: hypothetical protein ACC609_00650 [Methanobacterium formicicum]